MKDLKQGEFNTDKPQKNLDLYSENFERFRRQKVSMLELGVLNGGSLELWTKFFEDVKVVGLDINEVKVEDNKRIRFYKGDQSDVNLLKKITEKETENGFEIIIDDASHFGKETFTSFIYLFKNSLKPGGIYVVEDWGTGYWPHYPDGRRISLDEHNLSFHLHNKTDYQFKKKGIINKGETFNKKRFKSHDFGMVGVIKQLIDELAINDATNTNLTGFSIELDSLISKIIISRGICFIYKQ
jgi:SAM-dependent methyltransferase